MAGSYDVAEGELPVIDPYDVLGLETTATADEIKRAYRKLALKSHPDKVSEDQKEQAHVTFQGIAFAYAILSDPGRRKRYDETGSTSESIVDAEGFSWSDYYREQYRDAVSSDTIKRFAEGYKGSDEERRDLLAAYEKHKGRMGRVYEVVMLSDVREDDERFRREIDGAIASGEVAAHRAYTHETARARASRIRAAEREAAEAEAEAEDHEKLSGGAGRKKQKGSSEADLAALIGRNQQRRGDELIANLMAKYGGNSKTKKGARKRGPPAEQQGTEEEPSEEAFQAAAARLKKRR